MRVTVTNSESEGAGETPESQVRRKVWSRDTLRTQPAQDREKDCRGIGGGRTQLHPRGLHNLAKEQYAIMRFTFLS